MIEIQITGIRKPGGVHNTHEAISHYRWQDAIKTAIWTREQMVTWILQDTSQYKAFVVDRRGQRAYCKVVKNNYGTIFLETYADGTVADNLLNLPSC